MNRAIAVFLLILSSTATAAPRFVAVDIVMESDQPVAAWQFELRDRNDGMAVVGVENGDSEAFGTTAYYDRRAVEAGSADRIIVADYSLADSAQLPSGTFRLATIHMMLEDSRADLDLQLITATTHNGERADAVIRLVERTGSQP